MAATLEILGKENVILTFTKSNKGQPLIVLNGYLYKCNKKTSDKKYWICNYVECRQSIHTDLNNVYIRGDLNPHDHEPNPDLISAKEVRIKIKERAVQENIPISLIYEQEIANPSVNATTIAVLPTSEELGNFFYRSLRLIRFSGFQVQL